MKFEATINNKKVLVEAESTKIKKVLESFFKHNSKKEVRQLEILKGHLIVTQEGLYFLRHNGDLYKFSQD